MRAECNVDDGTCQDLADEFPWMEKMTHEGALAFKYIVDVWVLFHPLLGLVRLPIPKFEGVG